MTAPMMTLPRSVVAYEDARAQVIRELVTWVSRMWPPTRPMDPEVWFRRYAEAYTDAVVMAQLEVVLLAGWSVDHALQLQGVPLNRAAGEVDPMALVSTDGAGRPVMGMAYSSAGVVGGAVEGAQEAGGNAGVAMAQAWQSAGRSLAVATQTTLSDTSRTAKSTAMVARDTGWIRVLTPPSCRRCVPLAGKYHRRATADFKRHPGCDCTQMPYDYDEEHPDFKGLFFDSNDYFRSLPQEQQDKVFGLANAQAIRDGADVNQVINAERGMTTVRDRFGMRTRVTTEGTTKKGWASRYLRQTYDAKMVKQPGSRYRRTNRPRLIPEEIYAMAGDDRDMVLNLLHKNGYLRTAGPRLTGEFDFFPRDREVAEAAARVTKRLAARGVRAA